ncbi:MAG: MarR family transcriptional regulator [Micavibrio sp.]|mgnify:CR=1 FL=1|nr:MarR family transcriptional regulator [Micavibrio sp.]
MAYDCTETVARQSLAHIRPFYERDPKMPLSYVMCLHYIALEPGISLTDLSKKLNIQLPTVSRIIRALEDEHLIDVKTAKNERRRKELFLIKDGIF